MRVVAAAAQGLLGQEVLEALAAVGRAEIWPMVMLDTTALTVWVAAAAEAPMLALKQVALEATASSSSVTRHEVRGEG